MLKPLLAFSLTFLGTWAAKASSLAYVPENFSSKTARIVVVIHGCLQTPESMALGTGWNQLADRHNLVVIYPQVPTGSNPIDCWSWYAPENQSSVQGQLASVQKEIRSWKARLGLETAPVFATGISSGAATVSGLLACFPEEFAAGAIHSGPSYGLATSLTEGEAVLKHGPRKTSPTGTCHPEAFQKPVMVVHGTSDAVVNPLHVNRIASDFFGTARAIAKFGAEANGLKYSIEDYKLGSELRGRIVLVEGLGHAWAGYGANLRHSALLGPAAKIPTQIPFFSQQGPSSTNLIFDFFASVR